jgi:hypothetical protein
MASMSVVPALVVIRLSEHGIAALSTEHHPGQKILVLYLAMRIGFIALCRGYFELPQKG